MHLFNTFWSPEVLYKFTEPYLVYAFGALVIAGVGHLALLLKTKLHLDISASTQAELEQAATNAAGRILASQEKTFADTKIDLKSPLVAAEVPIVVSSLSKALRSDVSPEDVQKLILAKLGTIPAAKS